MFNPEYICTLWCMTTYSYMCTLLYYINSELTLLKYFSFLSFIVVLKNSSVMRYFLLKHSQKWYSTVCISSNSLQNKAYNVPTVVKQHFSLQSINSIMGSSFTFNRYSHSITEFQNSRPFVKHFLHLFEQIVG